jgi:hypothetical protein
MPDRAEDSPSPDPMAGFLARSYRAVVAIPAGGVPEEVKSDK